MTWWLWALAGLAVWLVLAFIVAWIVGHFARIGSGE